MSERFWSVCRSDVVPDPGCKEFEVRFGETLINGFVVHWRGQWYAYKNSCPHVGASLNWQPNQFFDFEQKYLQCGVHGALFQPHNGLCVSGPCHGLSLDHIDVVQREGEILIDCAQLTPG